MTIAPKLRSSLRVQTGSHVAVTPLVDVLFILFIFFMMGSSLVFQPGISVDMPETIDEFIGVADKLVVTMTREKLVFFNDQHVEDWNDLRRKLNDMSDGGWGGDGPATGRAPIIILKADREVAYDDIVRVMSLIREYGMSVFLATKRVGD